MNAWNLVPLVACLVGSGLAAAVLSRDPGNRAHQLLAGVLAISAYWSLLEVIWNGLEDPVAVVHLVRLSGLAWPWLGPLVAHFFLELVDDPEERLRPARRLLPLLYAATGVSAAIYAATPWCVTRAVPTSFGWSFEFGPLFPVVYLQTSIPPALVVLDWRRVYPARGSRVERREWAWGWALLVGVLAGASLTDAILPALGIHVPRFGSASVTLLGVLVAVSLTRYGHSLLAPGAFATEIVATLGEGVALARRDGRIRMANPALERLAGVEAGGLLDGDLDALLPDLGTRGGAGWRERPATLVRRDGGTLPVAVAASPLRDPRGLRLGSVVAVRDLREMVELRERLVTSGRLAAVGELSAGIAREIQQPIARVRDHLAELRREWGVLSARAGALLAAPPEGLFAEGEELIDESLEGVDRIGSIARDVGSFSGLSPVRGEVALRAVLEGALRLARPCASARVRLEADLGPVPPVRGASQELEQVFLNLLLNAIQAVEVEGGGTVLVRTVSEDAGGTACVRVEDDGCGIAPDDRARIFDPFFTTKPVGEGTGLGLAISYQIVTAHGGEIRVDSEPGAGAAFEVRLPAAAPERAAAGSAQSTDSERRTTGQPDVR